MCEPNRYFESANGLDLDGPEAAPLKWRHVAEVAAKLGVEACQADQFAGAVEREDLAAAKVGFQGVGEAGLDAGGLVRVGQRQVDVWDGFGQALGVLGGLDLDAGERVAFGLGLDHAEGLGVSVEHVVGVAGLEGELACRDARSGGQVHRGVILHHPAALLEAAVDSLPGLLFGGHGVPQGRGGERIRCDTSYHTRLGVVGQEPFGPLAVQVFPQNQSLPAFRMAQVPAQGQALAVFDRSARVGIESNGHDPISGHPSG